MFERIQGAITLLAARDQHGVIGKNNQLPWHLPEDLHHFRDTTRGHVIIMGRRTFESIGRALPQRRTILITSHSETAFPGCDVARSLAEALQKARSEWVHPHLSSDLGEKAEPKEIFIVGGAQLFRSALPIATRALITEIQLQIVDGDAWFPTLSPMEWCCASRKTCKSASGIDYEIVDYRRAQENSLSTTSALSNL